MLNNQKEKRRKAKAINSSFGTKPVCNDRFFYFLDIPNWKSSPDASVRTTTFLVTPGGTTQIVAWEFIHGRLGGKCTATFQVE